MGVERTTSKHRYAWLALGGILMVFYNGNAVAIASWLAPLLVLRFARTCSGKEFMLVPAVLVVSHGLLLYAPFSNASIPPVFRILFGMACGLIVFIPYLADRLLTKKITGFTSTLIFPAAWVSVEYVLSLVSPLATFGVIGYTQAGCIPLVQLVSITGIWGLSFVVIWFSSTVNWAWDHGFRLREIRIGAAVYAAVLLAVFLYGEFRLHNARVMKTIRVAASSRSYDAGGMFRHALKTGSHPSLEENARVFDTFIRKTALPGSVVVFWQEYALITGESDEQKIVEHARSAARRKCVYLGLPVGVVKNKGAEHLLENKVIWISPDGKILSSYIKSYTAPWETSSSPVKEISAFKTAFGTAGTAICFDMDFPWLIRQAGEKNIRLMLAPSSDWRGIAPFHSYMAVFRAVENGFSLVRPAGENGVSIASDPFGRTVASLDNMSSDDKIMTAAVPLYSIRTVYSKIGDLFAWLCIAGLAAALFIVLRRFKSR